MKSGTSATFITIAISVLLGIAILFLAKSLLELMFSNWIMTVLTMIALGVIGIRIVYGKK